MRLIKKMKVKLFRIKEITVVFDNTIKSKSVNCEVDKRYLNDEEFDKFDQSYICKTYFVYTMFGRFAIQFRYVTKEVTSTPKSVKTGVGAGSLPSIGNTNKYNSDKETSMSWDYIV